MPGHIARKPLFTESEKREIDRVLIEMELDAEEEIERHPERRAMILAHLAHTSKVFIRRQVRRKRLETVIFGLAMMVVGAVIVSLAGTDSKLAMMFGMSCSISGVGTALIAAVRMLGA